MSEENTQTPPADDTPKGDNPEDKKPEDASPGSSQDTPASGQEEETVTLPKSEAERLQKLSEKEEELTGREQKVTKREQKLKEKRKASKSKSTSSSPFSFEEPAPNEPSDDEIAREKASLQVEREVLKVERGVNKILGNPDYADFLQANPILSAQLQNAPMGLHIFAIEQAVDADDALSKIEDYLDDESAKFSPSTTKKKDDKEEDTKDQPDAAPTNPSSGEKPDEDKKKEHPGRKRGIFKSEIEQVGDKLSDRISKGG